MLVHTVFFWLKPETPAAARAQLLADCTTYLKAVPTVRQLWAGAPSPTTREIIDRSYQVGITVVFDDLAGHDVYQVHPLHKEFIQRNREHWARVQIYDFTE